MPSTKDQKKQKDQRCCSISVPVFNDERLVQLIVVLVSATTLICFSYFRLFSRMAGHGNSLPHLALRSSRPMMKSLLVLLLHTTETIPQIQ